MTPMALPEMGIAAGPEVFKDIFLPMALTRKMRLCARPMAV